MGSTPLRGDLCFGVAMPTQDRLEDLHLLLEEET